MGSFINFIKDEWRERKVIFVNEVISFVTGLGAATYQSFVLTKINYILYYILFTVSAFTAIVSSIGRKSVPLLLANVGYLFLDLFGLVKAIIEAGAAGI
ncbi:MAG: hypothetical protein LBI70_02965 [Rickettsiales bacterium]|jgi:hypothetical protein|nr:hypothetical protein [Rickettsiales bacterium]